MNRTHLRNHRARSVHRGRAHPDYLTVDRQPTQPFSVTLARCRFCGSSLRAVAGGGWTDKQTCSTECRRHRGWFGRLLDHEVDATPPAELSWSPWLLLIPIAVVGPALMWAAISLANALAAR